MRPVSSEIDAFCSAGFPDHDAVVAQVGDDLEHPQSIVVYRRPLPALDAAVGLRVSRGCRALRFVDAVHSRKELMALGVSAHSQSGPAPPSLDQSAAAPLRYSNRRASWPTVAGVLLFTAVGGVVVANLLRDGATLNPLILVFLIVPLVGVDQDLVRTAHGNAPPRSRVPAVPASRARRCGRRSSPPSSTGARAAPPPAHGTQPNRPG